VRGLSFASEQNNNPKDIIANGFMDMFYSDDCGCTKQQAIKCSPCVVRSVIV